MHELLFHRQQALEDADLRGYAAELGLDVERFDADRASAGVLARIRRDVESGLATGEVLRHPDLVHRRRRASGPVRRRLAAAGGHRPMTATCTHLDQIELLELPEPIEGCAECLASGGSWVHLRMCQSCGQIGCCDSSPNRHASRHARATGHAIARSAEPGEDWSWCYVDEVAFVVEAR